MSAEAMVVTAAYIAGVFIVFFLSNLLFDLDEDGKKTAATISLIWPVSLSILAVTGIFIMIADSAEEIKDKRKQKEWGEK